MKNFTENLTNEDVWSRPSPISPTILNLLGGFLAAMMVLGVTLNGFLLNVFIQNKDLRTPLNALIITVTVFNFVGCFTQLPWIIHSSFSHR